MYSETIAPEEVVDEQRRLVTAGQDARADTQRIHGINKRLRRELDLQGNEAASIEAHELVVNSEHKVIT